MKTLEDFTPEIRAKIPQYIENGIANIFDGGYYHQFNIEKAQACVNWNYNKAGFKSPKVIVAGNPFECVVLYKELLKKNGKSDIEVKKILKGFSYYTMYLFTMNIYSNYYYQWYKFIKDEFKISLVTENEFEVCFKLQRESGIYCAIFLEDYCIISKYPKIVHRDTNNNLHSIVGQAVEWESRDEESAFNCYYIHGRLIQKDIFLKALNEEVTKEIWLKEKNEETKSAWYEILGPKLLNILDAKIVDSTYHTHLNNEIEELTLFKTQEILPEIGEKLAWVKFVCPSTGTSYLISVNPIHERIMDAVLDTCPFFGQEIQCIADYKFTARS